MVKKITFIGIVALYLFAIISYLVYKKMQHDYRIKYFGVPYKDERTVTVSVNEENKYIIDRKEFISPELIENLNKLTEEYGCDFPLVMKFATKMMNKNLNPYLETITQTSAYKLHFAYKKEILPIHLPAPCARAKTDFNIYISQNQNDSVQEYKIISENKFEETAAYTVASVTRDELIAKLKEKSNVYMGLVLNSSFTKIESFLELLYICRKAECETLEIRCYEPEFEIQVREAEGKITISAKEEE